jgi:hypothetical protein
MHCAISLFDESCLDYSLNQNHLPGISELSGRGSPNLPIDMMTTDTTLSNPDSLFRPLQFAGVTIPNSPKNATLSLMNQAFSGPSLVQHIYTQKLEHRPLSINPASDVDARESRRRKRLLNLKRKRKPKPLSAKEKKELRIFDTKKSDIKFVSF